MERSQPSPTTFAHNPQVEESRPLQTCKVRSISWQPGGTAAVNNPLLLAQMNVPRHNSTQLVPGDINALAMRMVKAPTTLPRYSTSPISAYCQDLNLPHSVPSTGWDASSQQQFKAMPMLPTCPASGVKRSNGMSTPRTSFEPATTPTLSPNLSLLLPRHMHYPQNGSGNLPPLSPRGTAVHSLGRRAEGIVAHTMASELNAAPPATLPEPVLTNSRKLSSEITTSRKNIDSSDIRIGFSDGRTALSSALTSRETTRTTAAADRTRAMPTQKDLSPEEKGAAGADWYPVSFLDPSESHVQSLLSLQQSRQEPRSTQAQPPEQPVASVKEYWETQPDGTKTKVIRKEVQTTPDETIIEEIRPITRPDGTKAFEVRLIKRRLEIVHDPVQASAFSIISARAREELSTLDDSNEPTCRIVTSCCESLQRKSALRLGSQLHSDDEEKSSSKTQSRSQLPRICFEVCAPEVTHFTPSDKPNKLREKSHRRQHKSFRPIGKSTAEALLERKIARSQQKGNFERIASLRLELLQLHERVQGSSTKRRLESSDDSTESADSSRHDSSERGADSPGCAPLISEDITENVFLPRPASGCSSPVRGRANSKSRSSFSQADKQSIPVQNVLLLAS